MTYIRTKSEIVKVETVADVQTKVIYKDNFVKQSDNIEKLLDQVVAVDSHGCTPAVLGRFLGDFCLDNWIEDNNGRYEFFGAIWTDKGLIYVAKMNEDGEFELI